MPTYEYECNKGHQFEVVQRISDPPLKRCRICRSKVQRLISASTFILKGGGWYADGYGSSRSASPAGDGASASSSDGKASGDSKASGDAKKSGSSESTAGRTSDSKSSSSGK